MKKNIWTGLARVLSLAAATMAVFSAQAASDDGSDKVFASGILRVAVYKEYAPWHDDGKGIDVDIAKAIAGKLALRPVFMPFDADDNMNDDLRNMVWKGHYMGYGPADVMMHVPVDRVLMEKNPQAKIFAPYFRDQIKVARDLKKLPQLDSLSAFSSEKIGVEGASISSVVMLAAEAGKYVNNVVNFKTPQEAVDALVEGKVSAVMATDAELQSGLRDKAGSDKPFFIADIALPGLPPKGWPVGVSVKGESEELARRIQKAMNDLIDSGEMTKIFAGHGVRYTKP